MDHVAIMKKSWGLTDKILSHEKVIESRWYKNKSAPWGRIKISDTVFFKNSGEPIICKAEVKKVLQFENLTPKRVREILNQYYIDDGIEKKDLPNFYSLFKNKNFCLLVFLCNVKKVKPFAVNKEGFGAMSAWMCVESIEKVKTRNIREPV